MRLLLPVEYDTRALRAVRHARVSITKIRAPVGSSPTLSELSSAPARTSGGLTATISAGTRRSLRGCGRPRPPAERPGAPLALLLLLPLEHRGCRRDLAQVLGTILADRGEPAVWLFPALERDACALRAVRHVARFDDVKSRAVRQLAHLVRVELRTGAHERRLGCGHLEPGTSRAYILDAVFADRGEPAVRLLLPFEHNACAFRAVAACPASPSRRSACWWAAHPPCLS